MANCPQKDCELQEHHGLHWNKTIHYFNAVPVLDVLPKVKLDSTTFEDFEKYFDQFFADCQKMRDTKGKEYAHSTSRFANFNRAAERLGISREMVANVYLHKHLDAIDSYIMHKETYSGENIRGRLIDAVTYLILIGGMIELQ